MKEGLAGKIAKMFIGSKLTVLLMIVFMVIGVYSSFLIPREEEPQIDVPMADIFVGYPGASPTEVESRVTKPLEKLDFEHQGGGVCVFDLNEGTGDGDRAILRGGGY